MHALHGGGCASLHKHTLLLRLVNVWYTTDGKDKRWREEAVMLGLICLGKDKGGISYAC